MRPSALALVTLAHAGLPCTHTKTWVVSGGDPAATDKGPATAAAPLKTIGPAAAQAKAGDTVLVHGGAVYRERVAPANGGVIYSAAPGATRPVIRGSESLPPSAWSAPTPGRGDPTGLTPQKGVWAANVTGLPFERIAGGIFNPYAIRLAFPGNESVSGSDGSSCDGGHTLGQLFLNGALLTEQSGARQDFHCNCTGKPDCTGGGDGCPGTYRYSCGTPCGQACGQPCGLDVNCSKPVCDDDTCGCSHAGQLAGCCNFTGTNAYPVLPPMSWMAVHNGTEIWARFADDGGTPPQGVEATVRKSVFAPHVRGLGSITVRGFIMEHAANQWDDFFWLPRSQENNPSPAAFAQGGLLSTRSGHDWVVEHNVLRHAKTIGIDIGDEGGADPEGSQQMPWVLGNHTVRWNRIVDNGGKGITGEFGSVGPQPFRDAGTGEVVSAYKKPGHSWQLAVRKDEGTDTGTDTSSDGAVNATSGEGELLRLYHRPGEEGGSSLLRSQPCPGCEVHRNRGGVIANNIIAGNNYLGCGAAENAALKVHGFSGEVVGNLLIGNFDR
jgi:hypothetical protein